MAPTTRPSCGPLHRRPAYSLLPRSHGVAARQRLICASADLVEEGEQASASQWSATHDRNRPSRSVSRGRTCLPQSLRPRPDRARLGRRRFLRYEQGILGVFHAWRSLLSRLRPLRRRPLQRARARSVAGRGVGWQGFSAEGQFQSREGKVSAHDRTIRMAESAEPGAGDSVGTSGARAPDVPLSKSSDAARRWGIFFKILTFVYLFILLFLALGWLGGKDGRLRDVTPRWSRSTE